MTDPSRPIKNPNRVPMSLQLGAAGDPIGTAGINPGPGVQIVRSEAATRQESTAMSFKRNRETGTFEVVVDGVYVNPATGTKGNPQSGDRFQFRKGHIVPEDVAKTFKRVGPWPGEPDELAIEEQVTNKSGSNPLNNDPARPQTVVAPDPATQIIVPNVNDPAKPEKK